MPKLTTMPAPTVHDGRPQAAPSAALMAEIRAGIDRLYRLGFDMFGDYWVQELHRVDGHPIERRWTPGALRLIERDLIQAELEAGRD